MFSGTGDKTLKIWDAATGQVLRVFEGQVGSVAISPDGARVLTGSADKLKLWEMATARLLQSFEGHSLFVTSVAFSPDGARVLSGSNDKTIKLWDEVTGNLLRTFEGHTGKAVYEGVESVAFSPDGKQILSGGTDSTMRLWDAASGKLLRTTPHPNYVYSVAFSRDGTQALSGSWDNMARLWDIATGRLLRTFAGHSNYVSSAIFSPDGTRVLTASYDKTMRLWDVATGRLLRIFEGHSEYVSSVAFSPDGTRVLSASGDYTVKLWNANTGEVLATLTRAEDGEWLAITPEGFFVASKKGADLLSAVRGFEVYSIDQLFQSLYRPDLVREKLAGDPKGLVREAAAKLDLGKVIASGAAPEVAITSPTNGASEKDQVTVAAQVTDKGGGIGRIEWRVNGTTFGVDEVGVAAGSGTKKVTRTLTLDDGDNTIEVVAYNAKNLIASVPARIRVISEGTIATPRGCSCSRLALTITTTAGCALIFRSRTPRLWSRVSKPPARVSMNR
jgi:WD40 repeat protein